MKETLSMIGVCILVGVLWFGYVYVSGVMLSNHCKSIANGNKDQFDACMEYDPGQ